MKKYLIIIGVLILIGIAFFAGMALMNEQKEKEEIYKTPAELKLELKQKENMSPISYLEVETKLNHDIKKGGLFRKRKIDGQIISGTVKNTATAATYKDVVIRVQYYSKTKTEIGKKDFVIYEEYLPNSKKEFRYKIEIPDATETYHATIIEATPVL